MLQYTLLKVYGTLVKQKNQQALSINPQAAYKLIDFLSPVNHIYNTPFLFIITWTNQLISC